MPQVINTNIASLNAQRNLNQSQSSLATALQRLSSGLRINSAKDDAAGMAIADRMTSQIRGLDQAQRNSNDGISLVQTAEGAMVNVSDNLQRIRELAVQSANASNTSSDRASINEEVQQLLQEIDRVANTTQFNGQNLLDGAFSKAQFQVGANANQTIGITMNSMRIANLGTGDTSAVSTQGATGRSTTVLNGVPSTGPALMNGDLVINGVAIGASSAASDTSSNLNKAASAISKVAAINAMTAQTGVTAAVQTNTMAGSSMVANAGLSGQLVINGFTTSAISTTADLSVTRQSVVAAINAISLQTGVVATDTGQDTGGVRLDAVDGRNISVVAAGAGDTLTAQASGLNTGFVTGDIADAVVQYGGYTLSSSKDVVIAQGVGGTLSNSGLSAATYKPQLAYASSTSTTTTDLAPTTALFLSSGDVKINGTLVGASMSSSDTASYCYGSASAIAKAAAVNAVSSVTGVTATANPNLLTGASMAAVGALTGAFTVNGIQTASVTTTTDAAANRALVVSAINAISGQTGVKAVDTNSLTTGVRLEAADGRNIVVGTGAGGLTQADTGVTMSALGVETPGSQYVTYGNISLTSAKSFTVDSGTSGNGTSAFGIAIGNYGGAKNGAALSMLDISTVEGANAALTAVDNALTQINSARAALGAFQNRFASTVSTLQATSENLSAARSRIRDADFAMETANMTRAQILQQAGTAMLAQANALPNTVLSLLK